MSQQTLSTREFLRAFSRITQRPKFTVYTIVRHGKPVGSFTPYRNAPKKELTLADLKKVRFHSGDKHLSEKIDEIVYGISRKGISRKRRSR